MGGGVEVARGAVVAHAAQQLAQLLGGELIVRRRRDGHLQRVAGEVRLADLGGEGADALPQHAVAAAIGAELERIEQSVERARRLAAPLQDRAEVLEREALEAERRRRRARAGHRRRRHDQRLREELLVARRRLAVAPVALQPERSLVQRAVVALGRFDGDALLGGGLVGRALDVDEGDHWTAL